MTEERRQPTDHWLISAPALSQRAMRKGIDPIVVCMACPVLGFVDGHEVDPVRYPKPGFGMVECPTCLGWGDVTLANAMKREAAILALGGSLVPPKTP